MFHADNAYFYPALRIGIRGACGQILFPTRLSAASAARRAWSSPSA
jgi:xanthine dehydrogenase molybdopterin-binding subunit B